MAKEWQKSIDFCTCNPTPEILPEEILAVRQDAIMLTGRTDYPIKLITLLCFPSYSRSLDAGDKHQ